MKSENCVYKIGVSEKNFDLNIGDRILLVGKLVQKVGLRGQQVLSRNVGIKNFSIIP